MKYYRLNDEVFAFELDGSQDEYIKPDMVLMNDDEVNRHLNPEEDLSDAVKYDMYLDGLPSLDRRQFKLALMYEGLLDIVEDKIADISDPYTRVITEIEYSESTMFTRKSETVLAIAQALELDNVALDRLWEKGASI